MTSVVTPCRTFGSWSGSAKIIRPECEWRSMKPGAYHEASRVDAALGRDHLLGLVEDDAQPAVADADRRREAGLPAAVDDCAVLDDQVERLARLTRAAPSSGARRCCPPGR